MGMSLELRSPDPFFLTHRYLLRSLGLSMTSDCPTCLTWTHFSVLSVPILNSHLVQSQLPATALALAGLKLNLFPPQPCSPCHTETMSWCRGTKLPVNFSQALSWDWTVLQCMYHSLSRAGASLHPPWPRRWSTWQSKGAKSKTIVFWVYRYCPDFHDFSQPKHKKISIQN